MKIRLYVVTVLYKGGILRECYPVSSIHQAFNIINLLNASGCRACSLKSYTVEV